MLEEIPYATFLEWRQFDQVSPIGDRRSDWQAASICAAVMNAMTMGHGVQTRFAPKDFLLEFGVEKAVKNAPAPDPAPNWKRMKSIARMFTTQANTDEERKSRIRNGRRR